MMDAAQKDVLDLIRAMSPEEARRFYMSEYGADEEEAEELVRFSHRHDQDDIFEDLPPNIARGLSLMPSRAHAEATRQAIACSDKQNGTPPGWTTVAATPRRA